MDVQARRRVVEQDLERLFPGRPAAPRIFTDTTDFYAINSGDVVWLSPESRFLVGNNTREGRFGLDDEVKHWVKRARNLATGSRAILKLVFYERFTTNMGGVSIECYRSPRKEARILDLVRGHPSFMHGAALPDEAGNPVRVLEVIPGRNLPDEILALSCGHERYFHDVFPCLLRRFLTAAEGIALLHENRERHGDVRRDHLIVDAGTGHWRWIDFDYEFLHTENIHSLDVVGLGNILVFLAGKGDVIVSDLKRDNPEAFDTLYWEDLSLVWRNRVANLGKVYGYIPDSLNAVLTQFSNQGSLRYRAAGEMVEDLGAALEDLPEPEVVP